MDDRGRMSQVSVNVSNRIELLSNGLSALEILALMGCLAFPFIDRGKGLGYTRERKRKQNRRKRKTERKRAPRSHHSSSSIGGSC
jgi:hypothetical protein